ncbi:hypothetical protein NDU88_007860 [Pleurodeles waltl]|uniref:Uncharacterized protein n=1 Tax=Pleurodeles waltl TaxID=8319 RepID=A0AAV7RUF8_PLEWA|nr:hypothetical protein NDU88_007860 [Pleurodeles waltl]
MTRPRAQPLYSVFWFQKIVIPWLWFMLARQMMLSDVPGVTSGTLLSDTSEPCSEQLRDAAAAIAFWRSFKISRRDGLVRQMELLSVPHGGAAEHSVAAPTSGHPRHSDLWSLFAAGPRALTSRLPGRPPAYERQMCRARGPAMVVPTSPPPRGKGSWAFRHLPASLGLRGARVRGPRCYVPAPDAAPGLPSSFRRRGRRAGSLTLRQSGLPHTVLPPLTAAHTRSAVGRHLPQARSPEAGRVLSDTDQRGPFSYSIAPRGEVAELPAAAISASRPHRVASQSLLASGFKAAVIWPLTPFGGSRRGHRTPASIVVVLGRFGIL